LKEKLLAALRGGLKTVLIPSENEKDLVEIPAPILAALDSRALKKAELEKTFRHRIPADLPDWVAFSVVVSVGAAT